MNFSDKFKEICDEIKKTLPPLKEESNNKFKKSRVKYNIHRRSLPVGTDQVVMLGLTREEADWMISRKLKAKATETESGAMQIIYYDAVQDDGTLSGVFENPKEVIKEDVWIG